MIGRTISHYRVLAKLGEGGMGVVYAAEDLSLHRTVALKFLSRDMFDSRDAVTRLIHEARTAASLNHPNICTIHEVGEIPADFRAGSSSDVARTSPAAAPTPPAAAGAPSDSSLPPGTPFIAMERIEGLPLAGIIESIGPMPLKQLLDTARQVAEGLAAAHARGIVHRDLKPQNVMVTAEGRVKILDFGLAKPIDREDPIGEATTVLISAERERRGMVMGTVAYMSPEQALGKPVDSRSDVFSFGIVLYEMATGKRPFAGETTTATLAQIIERDPQPPTAIRKDLPPELERIIRRCLNKDPEDRYHDTRDLAFELRELRHREIGATSGARAARPVRRVGLLRIGIPSFIVLAVALAAGWWWTSRHRPVSPREVKATQLTAFRARINDLRWPALSPDGRKLAYIYKGDLDLVLLESGDHRTLLRTNADSLSLESIDWHPDSEQLIIETRVREGMLTWLMNVVTNRRRVIHVDSTRVNPILSPDGNRLALLRDGLRQLAILSIGSDSLQVLRTADQGKRLGAVAWSPNSKRLLYYESGERGAPGNYWTSDLSGNRRAMEPLGQRIQEIAGRGTCWLADGRLLHGLSFGSGLITSQIWALDADPFTGESAGTRRKVFERINARIGYLSASADGKRLAFNQEESRRRLLMLDLGQEPGRSSPQRLAVEDWPATGGVWSRDGRSIFFSVERPGPQADIYVRRLTADREEVFLTDPGWKLPACLSPDGNSLLYWLGKEGRWELMSIPIAGGPSKVLVRYGPRRPGHIRSAPLQGGTLVTGVRQDKALIVRKLSADGVLAPDSLEIELTEGIIWTDMDISSDGKQIVVLESTGRVRLIDLETGRIRELCNALPSSRKDMDQAQFLSWSEDRGWLYVSGMGVASPLGLTSTSRFWYSVWRLSADGMKREVIWESEDTWPSYVRPSPDGRYIAFNTLEWENDVWMIEGF